METNLDYAKPSQRKTSWLDDIARNQLFRIADKLENAGLTIEDDGQRHFFGDSAAQLQAVIHVSHPVFYRQLLLNGSIGAGESWTQGYWSSPNLTAVIRVFARCMDVVDQLEKRLAWINAPLNKLGQLATRNSKSGSRSNIAAHYDLGNDLYQTFLDPLMQYSSAIFPSPTSTLEYAQEFKLKTICDKLALCPQDHLLEIGTGWGGLAVYAARNYGCRVTTTTLSKEQFDYAKAWVDKESLGDKVTLLLKDYRDLEGQYNKLVSIEMIEAVGHQYLPVYFSTLNRLLKPEGRMLIQAITIADQRYQSYIKSTDFIQKHIFPGGCLPSTTVMNQQLAQQTDMTTTRLTSHGHDYAETLRHWANRFNTHSKALNKIGYDNKFQRLWNFYFSYCEGGFREGTIDLVQLEASKPGARICLSGQ